MNFSPGTPTWTWPNWRKAAPGTRFRSNQSGRHGTFIKPSKVRNNGAIVLWDAHDRWPAKRANVVAPARELTPVIFKAWDLIGFDGKAPYDDQAEAVGNRPAYVKITHGRALYEAVLFSDENRGQRVKLARLETKGGLREVSRYVDPDTPLEIVVTPVS